MTAPEFRRYTFGVIALLTAGCVSACQPSARETPRTAERGSDSVAAASPALSEDQITAANVIRDYYRAIGERRYLDAYRSWESNGSASGKSFEDFRSGFSETATVDPTVGTPGPMGAAAGSRYIEVPIRVVATLRSGATQEFTGSYVVRRSVVDGATAEQRAWHIYSGKLRPVR
jgi:hypothetical protein